MNSKIIISTIIVFFGISCKFIKNKSAHNTNKVDSTASDNSWWKPTPQHPLSMQWELAKSLDTHNTILMGERGLDGKTLPAPDVYDIDGENNSASTVKYLHSKGAKVICYIDAGTYETYRNDSTQFKSITPQIWGNALSHWNHEYWLDIRRINELKPIMKARMRMCKEKGFDAIEPDNIDGYTNNTGFSLSYKDQLTYNKALAKWAHEVGMSIGQKNDISQIHSLVTSFDWILDEQCHQYNECKRLKIYTQKNKAVWIAEYNSFEKSKWDAICDASRENHFNTSRYKLSLDSGRMPCSIQSSENWQL